MLITLNFETRRQVRAYVKNEIKDTLELGLPSCKKFKCDYNTLLEALRDNGYKPIESRIENYIFLGLVYIPFQDKNKNRITLCADYANGRYSFEASF